MRSTTDELAGVKYLFDSGFTTGFLHFPGCCAMRIGDRTIHLDRDDMLRLSACALIWHRLGIGTPAAYPADG